MSEIIMIPAKLKLAGVTFDVELSVPNLQQVLDSGNEAEKDIVIKNGCNLKFKFGEGEESKTLTVEPPGDLTEDRSIHLPPSTGTVALIEE